MKIIKSMITYIFLSLIIFIFFIVFNLISSIHAALSQEHEKISQLIIQYLE